MTLADTRLTASTATMPVQTVSVSAALSDNQLEMLRAFFCYEFEVASLDQETVPAATAEAVEEWVDALEMSGLFAPAELRSIGLAFRSEPDALLSLIVGNVDEIAARREGAPAPAETPAAGVLPRAS